MAQNEGLLYYSAEIDDLPVLECAPLDLEVHAFYTGPDIGAAMIEDNYAPTRSSLGTPKATDNKEPISTQSQLKGSQHSGVMRSKTKSLGDFTKRIRLKLKRESTKTTASKCVQRWTTKNRKAYGMSVSLYDVHPVSGKVTGDPIADCFAVVAMRNSSLLVLADGVNWGERSMIAARSAVFGCIRFLLTKLGVEHTVDDAYALDSQYDKDDENGTDDQAEADGKCSSDALKSIAACNANANLRTTRDIFAMLIDAVHEAHRTVLEQQGGATTLCLALVVPLSDASGKPPAEFAVCCVNVGDSPAFLLSKRAGLHEVTVGSHDVDTNRDLKDTGGAIGAVYADGEPELHNLTVSLALAHPGDILLLTSDGVSDNFDPVVRRIASASTRPDIQLACLQQPFCLTPAAMNCIRHIDDESTDEEDATSREPSKPCESTPQTAKSNDSGYDDAHGASGIFPFVRGNTQQTSGPTANTDNHTTCTENENDGVNGNNDGTLYITARERYLMTVKEMERVINQFEADSQSRPGAHELCALLIQHAVACTQPKRFVLERSRIELAQRRKQLELEHGLVEDSPAHASDLGPPDGCSPRRSWRNRSPKLLRNLPFMLRKDAQTPQPQTEMSDDPVNRNVHALTDAERAAKKIKKAEVAKLLKHEKEQIEARLADSLRGVPGKFDHATICAVEIGTFRDDVNEDYELQC